MVDDRKGIRYSHLHVRRAPRFEIEGIKPSLYPRRNCYLDPEVGANLRFKEAENRKRRRRRTAGLSSVRLTKSEDAASRHDRILCLHRYARVRVRPRCRPKCKRATPQSRGPRRSGREFSTRAGKINPVERYGASMASARSAVVEDTIGD